MSYIESMLEPARLAALKKQAAHEAAMIIRNNEEELVHHIGAVGPVEQAVVRETVSNIWAELLQRDYSHLVED